MIVLGVLGVETRVATPPRPSLAVLTVGDGEPDGLIVEAEVDATPAEMAFARGALREQFCGLVVVFAGARIGRIISGSWEVSAAIGEAATWRFDVAMPSPLGAPAQHLGAPPGLAKVDLYGFYLTSTGRALVPMILNGKVHQDSRGIKVASIEGTDYLGRIDNTEADASLPAGHGLSTGQIIERWALSANVLLGRINAGARRFKAARIKGPWLADARARAEVEGWELQVSREGRLETVAFGYDPARPPDAYLTAHDLVDIGGNGPLQITTSSDLITRKTISGSAPVTRDSCGRRTLPPVSVSTFGTYAPVVAAFRQNGDGSLTATSATSEPAFLELSRTVAIREEACGSPLSDTEATYGWYNPEAARGEFNGDGTLNARLGPYLPAGAVAGDESPSYDWPGEKFTLVGYSQTRYTYDLRGFLVRTERATWVPRLTAAAVKSRPTPSDPWEEIAFDTFRRALGNRFGVVELSEIMPNPQSGTSITPTEIETIEYAVTDLGYITSQTRTLSKWWAKAGTLYLYGGDETRAAEEETLQPFEVERTDYLAEEGNRSHQSVRSLAAGDAKPVVTIERGLDGYLPQAQQQNLPLDGDDFPGALIAVPGESAGFEAEVIRYDLESHQGVQPGGTVSNAYIESAAEGQAVVERELRDGAAAQCSITLPLNWLLGRGSKLTITLPRSVDIFGLGPGVPFDFYVERETHASSGSPPQMTTTLSGLVYFAER